VLEAGKVELNMQKILEMPSSSKEAHVSSQQRNLIKLGSEGVTA
jgi:hypothetical protein